METSSDSSSELDPVNFTRLGGFGRGKHPSGSNYTKQNEI